MWIGAFIAVIEQLANSLGCALQLPLLIVGIVVVAAGTTVPDTWASVVAARHDADADAAIANAFGSCERRGGRARRGGAAAAGKHSPLWRLESRRARSSSSLLTHAPSHPPPPPPPRSGAVNVFLGLGLPWTVASIYQASRGLPFEAPAGDLAFSVALFTGLAAAAVLLLLAKRLLRGGELGGPTAADKFGTAGVLFAFWLTYVTVSGVRAVALEKAGV
jgi:solute carrier family 8 (sodium/calcium exchanger)